MVAVLPVLLRFVGESIIDSYQTFLHFIQSYCRTGIDSYTHTLSQPSPPSNRSSEILSVHIYIIRYKSFYSQVRTGLFNLYIYI